MTGLGHEGVVRGGRWRSLAGAVALVAAALILVAGSPAQAVPNRAYVTHVVPDVGTVSVIDTDTNAVVATVAVGDHPNGVATTPDGTRACVTAGRSNDVAVIDTASDTVVDRIAVGSFPSGVGRSPPTGAGST